MIEFREIEKIQIHSFFFSYSFFFLPTKHNVKWKYKGKETNKKEIKKSHFVRWCQENRKENFIYSIKF